MAAMAAATRRTNKPSAIRGSDRRRNQPNQKAIPADAWKRAGITTRTGVSMSEVNIPLLRKAVEWAEAEAAKPIELSRWEQGVYVSTPEDQRDAVEELKWGRNSGTTERLASKSPECGTCYCIAGYVAQAVDPRFEDRDSIDEPEFITARTVATEALRLDFTQAGYLFDGGNTIEDVRRIAESIAGESL